jgi:penicillin amidase
MRSHFGGIILRPKQKGIRTEILSKSFKETIAALEAIRETVPAWTWNKVHVVEYEHPLGKVAMLRKIFNVGPFWCSNEVLNQMFDYTK